MGAVSVISNFLKTTSTDDRQQKRPDGTGLFCCLLYRSPYSAVLLTGPEVSIFWLM